MRSGPIAPGLAAFLAVSVALGNGRFPAASTLAFDPSDPRHLILGTTFGVLESYDAGDSFSWTCEVLLGLAEQEDPMIAITESGNRLFATLSGVVFSRDGCSFQRVPELEGDIVPDLALSRGRGGQVFAFRTVGVASGRFASELLRSDDHGEHWQVVGAPLPDHLLPLTVDIAPSDPDRVYLSARTDKEGNYASWLLRSDDGGETFEQLPIPDTSGQRLAFIAAVHPRDADTLYLRVDAPTTVVMLSRDGGASFESVFTGEGRLLGFALSPNADELALGGPRDGVWIGGSDGSGLARRFDVGATCLGWNQSGLYVCSDALETGYSVGRSGDGVAPVEPLFLFEQLCGATACSSDTSAGSVCPAEWRVTAPRIGATCGVPPSGAGGTSGAGGASSRAGAGRGGISGGSSSDGGCSVGRAGASACGAWLLGALSFLRRRQRARGAAARRAA